MKKIVCLFSVGALLLSNLSFGNSTLISSGGKVFAASEYLKEDINQDGVIGLFDISEIINILLNRKSQNTENVLNSDVNGDGEVDILDSVKLKEKALEEMVQEQDVTGLNYKNHYTKSMRMDTSKAGKTVTINSYEELKSTFPKSDNYEYFAGEASKGLEDYYTEEFFKDNVLVVHVPQSYGVDSSFKSFSIEGNILYINSQKTDSIPYPWYMVKIFEFSRAVFSRYKFEKIEYRDITKYAMEKVKLDIYEPLKISTVDKWVGSNDELKSFLDENNELEFSESDLNLIYNNYDQSFFESNKLIIFSSRLYKPYITNVKYEKDYLDISLYGYGRDYIYEANDYNDEICFISVSRDILFEGQDTRIIENDNMIAYKPVIYLYPEEETNVSVSLDLNGSISCVYPEFDVEETNTWEVKAYPDGTLIGKDGSEYSYLFWEGPMNANWDMSKGYVVKGADTAAFLKSTLSKMGLTPKEYNDFIVFWLPIMKNNQYNYITFQNQEYTDNAVLNISPKPESVLRVFMAYQAIDKNQADFIMKNLEEPEITPFERNGFTVVEWGGTQIK